MDCKSLRSFRPDYPTHRPFINPDEHLVIRPPSPSHFRASPNLIITDTGKKAKEIISETDLKWPMGSPSPVIVA